MFDLLIFLPVFHQSKGAIAYLDGYSANFLTLPPCMKTLASFPMN
jgi:hypothetical protein